MAPHGRGAKGPGKAVAPAAASRPETPREAPGGGADTEVLALLLARTHDLVAVAAPDGRLRSANPALLDCLGRAQAEVGGLRLADLVHREQRDACARLFAAAAAGESATVETVLAAKEGHRVEVEGSVAALGAPGRVTALVLVLHDVTAKRRVERMLRHRLRLEETIAGIATRFAGHLPIEAAVDAALADVGVMCGAGRAVLWLFDDQALRMSAGGEWCAPGVPALRAELKDISLVAFPGLVHRLIGEEHHAVADAGALPAGDPDRALLERQGLRSALYLPLLIDGAVAGCLAVGHTTRPLPWRERDVALLRVVAQLAGGALERSRRDDRVRFDRQDWEDAFDSLAEFVTIHDLGYNVVKANRAARRVLGLDGGVGAAPPKCFAAYHGTAAPPQGCPSCACLASGKPTSFETWEPHLGIHLELTVIPRIDRDGNLRGLIHVGRDVSERRRAEEELRALNAELEGRVRERTARLERAAAEMESFTYAVAHDLRTPLRAIDGFSRILFEDHGAALDEVGRTCLRKVVRGAGRMGELIDALLALARCTRVKLAPREVDLSAMATAIAQRLAAASGGPVPEVVVEPGLRAHGDPELLRTALEHLLSNSWKFTAGCASPRIHVGAETDERGGRTYHVRDNGVGFEMAHAERLFGAFQRLHDPAEFPGTGIGLATVRQIVQRHGGRVRAEGAIGAGATFFFTLGTPELG